MLDKKRLKVIADRLGMKITFGLDSPGFFSENDKKSYSFSELEKIIDNTFND